MTKLQTSYRHFLSLTAGAAFAMLAGIPTLVHAAGLLDQQMFKGTTEAKFQIGNDFGHAALTNLNINVNSLLLLDVQWPKSSATTHYNLEIPEPTYLDGVRMDWNGIVLQFHNGQTRTCAILDQKGKDLLDAKAETNYRDLCSGMVYLRLHKQMGSDGGPKERGANFLRTLGALAGDSGAEKAEDAIEAYKEAHPDADLRKGEVMDASQAGEIVDSKNRPVAAHLNPAAAKSAIRASDLKIPLSEGEGGALKVGTWYKTKNHAGVFVSLIKPGMVADDILSGYPKRVNKLDGVESDALSYMVAFDMNNFTVGWEHGFNLPGVGWSAANHAARPPGAGGPDGFGNLGPIQTTGQLNPAYLPRLEGVMCGGFQRLQGNFRVGPMSQTNYGTYFGFMDNGVILSKLQNGLASFIMYKDGSIEIKPWTEQDNANIPKMRSVRQNAMPLVEPDPAHPDSGVGIPGATVSDWGLGAWSGTSDKNPEGKAHRRSSRSGVCISKQNGRRYMIYGFFSSVNPDSMARVFQAYECQNAIHLDMNSPGQAYLGLFRSVNNHPETEMPVQAMEVVNAKVTIDGHDYQAPRYVGQPDNADFFYVLRKK